MTNKISIKIQNKFFEIFNDFTNKPALISNTIKKNEKTFKKIMTKIVFLILLKIDGYLVDLVKQNTEYFFKTYMSILSILSNLKTLLNYDLPNEIRSCVSHIFSSTPNLVPESFDYNKVIEILGSKIKSMAPTKFDPRSIKYILDSLK
jgi:hypothetical protein